MMAQKPLIGFIGQGYVGKNMADDMEARGFSTVRYALEEPYVGSKDKIKECDIVFIAVPTPTTAAGFDFSIVDSAVALVGEGKVAVIKSTIVPGTTAGIQHRHPKQIVLNSPEFLSEATAAYDSSHPFANVVGMPEKSERHRAAAEVVHSVLPKASDSVTCTSAEAEIFKYTHNASAYTQIMFFNMMYDLAAQFDADWSVVHRAVLADPFIPNRYAQPIHKSGRGAGGHCFIKDFAALREVYEKHLSQDSSAIALLRANESQNVSLLRRSGKDIDLLAQVYGTEMLAGVEPIAPTEQIPVSDVHVLLCTQSFDESDPAFGYFRAWVEEFARRTRGLTVVHLQGSTTSLPQGVHSYSLGKTGTSRARGVQRIRYALRFLTYVWRERRAYDTVIVHINTEYVGLGGLLWKLLGKKVALVANEMESPTKARIAARFADVIFYTNRDVRAAHFPQSQEIPSGIDTSRYARVQREAPEGSLLFLGRIARDKGIEAIVGAVKRAARKHPCRLDFYGMTILEDDEAYEHEVRDRFQSFEASGLLNFRGAVLHERTPQIYAAHDIFVHAPSKTGFNKSLFEAMAAGCIVVSGAHELRDVIHPDLFVATMDEVSIARAIEAALQLSPEEKERERVTLRSYVEREHALGVIIPRMLQSIYPLDKGTRAVGV